MTLRKGEKEHSTHIKKYAFTDSMGYVEKLEWLEKMSKKYDQVKCDFCGLYAIFKTKKALHSTNNSLEEKT